MKDGDDHRLASSDRRTVRGGGDAVARSLETMRRPVAFPPVGDD